MCLSVRLSEMEQLALFAAFLILPLGIQAQSSSSSSTVQLINLMGDPVTATCVTANLNMNRPATVISPMGSLSWSFDGNLVSSAGWTCHFDWEDSSDCAGGPPCKLHSQDVKVWQGAMSLNRKLVGAGFGLTPCSSCVWQIKFDGFYRADQKDLVYAFVAPWN